jgi:hypothetical protein
MVSHYTEDQVRQMLARQCRDAGGQAAWADLHDVTPQYVCDVLQGRRLAGKMITRALGLYRALQARGGLIHAPQCKRHGLHKVLMGRGIETIRTPGNDQQTSTRRRANPA